MVAASVVVVGNDDDVGAGEMLGEVGLPFAGALALQVAVMPWRASVSTVFFAFDDENPIPQRDRLDELGQPVGHLPHALHAPHPAIFYLVRRVVRSRLAALPEVLRVEPADLEQQRAGLVGVFVCCDKLAPPVALLPLPAPLS